MEDGVKVAFKGKWLADVALDKGEARVAGQMGDVGGTAGNEIVEADYRVAISEKPINEVRTDKSGSPGDEDMHLISVG